MWEDDDTDDITLHECCLCGGLFDAEEMEGAFCNGCADDPLIDDLFEEMA